MNKKTIVIIAGLILALANPVGAEINVNAGTLGAQFLKLGVGARAVGMGEVFAGIADDINALYWNPAGLCRMSGMQLTGSYMMLFQGINHDFAAFGMPIGENMAFGVGASYVTLGGLEARTGDTDTADYLFGANNLAGIGAFSMKFGMFGVGASVKLIYEGIGVENIAGGGYAATGLAFDAGVHFASEGVEFGKGILAGAVVQNIGAGYSFSGPDSFTGVEAALPFNIKVGIAYKDMESNFTVGADVNMPADNELNLHFGGEYYITKLFAVRAGFKTTTLADLGFLSGLSVGAGFNLEKFAIDYAWVSYGVLDLFTHRFSVTAKF